jgi:hypothetical protein
MKLNRNDRKEEVAAITTLALLSAVIICIIGVIIQTIFNLF